MRLFKDRCSRHDNISDEYFRFKSSAIRMAALPENAARTSYLCRLVQAKQCRQCFRYGPVIIRRPEFLT